MPKAKLLLGKVVRAEVYSELQPRITNLKRSGITPGLAVIQVGNDPASQVYVNSKTHRFSKMGLLTETITLPSNTDENNLILTIRKLNKNTKFYGILVQLPLPQHLDSNKILFEIDPEKDVDGFHPVNLGKLVTGHPKFIPCTPKGVLRMLKYYKINLSGKHVVVVGRSNIVGRPLSILTSLKKKYVNATVTICHSGTPNISKFTRQADVLIAAIGVPELIDKSYIKEDVIIIDVGINRVEDDSEKGYKLVGDVNFESVNEIASAITPVPGGVGPMTIAMLVENTIEAAEAAHTNV